MNDYLKLELPALVEMLAFYSVRYTRMLGDKSTPPEELTREKEIIKLLQEAINLKHSPP